MSWAWELPVSACVIRMALSPSALRVPHVSYASVTGPSSPPRCKGNESKVYLSTLYTPSNSMLSLCHRCTSFPENGNKKTLTLAGARGKQSSRYHPGLLTPRGINLNECCENRLSNTPACNGTNRLDLLPQWRFNLQLRHHFQRWCGIDFSASSTLCSRP